MLAGWSMTDDCTTRPISSLGIIAATRRNPPSQRMLVMYVIFFYLYSSRMRFHARRTNTGLVYVGSGGHLPLGVQPFSGFHRAPQKSLLHRLLGRWECRGRTVVPYQPWRLVCVDKSVIKEGVVEGAEDGRRTGVVASMWRMRRDAVFE